MTLLLCLSFASMTLFCLAMDKHRKQIISRELPANLVKSFKPLAWVMTLVTFMLSIELYAWSIGPAVFFGALGGALLGLILLLTYYAKSVPLLAISLPIIGLLGFYS